MRVKLLLFTLYLNGMLHAVSVGKPSKRMSNFWTVRFFKNESEQNFGFPHIPRLFNRCRRSQSFVLIEVRHTVNACYKFQLIILTNPVILVACPYWRVRAVFNPVVTVYAKSIKYNTRNSWVDDTGECYHLNHAIVVKLYHPYIQFPSNVRLSHRRIVTFSGVSRLFWSRLTNTLTYLLISFLPIDRPRRTYYFK